MAEYYSLIKKAIARLDPSAHESRQTVYDRARAAQLAQLRIISPSLSKSEIRREQLALEDAVRRVEAEVARPPEHPKVPAISDLVAAADEIGRPVSRSEDGSSPIEAKALTTPVALAANVEIPASMTIRGRATGRLIRYWRWRALPPRLASSKRADAS